VWVTTPATEEAVVPKTLIVPVDGSATAARAVPVAQRIAEQQGSCDLVLVHADLRDASRYRGDLDALRERTQLASGTVRTVCETGDAAGVITRLAEIEPEPGICMSTHGRGRVTAALLGSVATEVLRNVRCPVVLVGPNCDEQWWHEPPHLVACWAGTGTDAVLWPSLAWSRQLGMDLSLLSVFHPLDVKACSDPRAQFAPALLQLDPDTVVSTIALFDDYPAGAIAERAAALPATLLAVTTRARAGLGRAVLGSVAMDIVHRSHCPVLVGRP
jgi:nucleotide-binding universal stress UspA family protein